MISRRVPKKVTTQACSSLALLMVGGGCATVNPNPDYDRARTLIEQSTGVAESYSPEDEGITPEKLGAQFLSEYLWAILALSGAFIAMPWSPPETVQPEPDVRAGGRMPPVEPAPAAAR